MVPVTTVSTLIVNTYLLLKHSCIFIKLCKALAVMDEKWRLATVLFWTFRWKFVDFWCEKGKYVVFTRRYRKENCLHWSLHVATRRAELFVLYCIAAVAIASLDDRLSFRQPECRRTLAVKSTVHYTAALRTCVSCSAECTPTVSAVHCCPVSQTENGWQKVGAAGGGRGGLPPTFNSLTVAVVPLTSCRRMCMSHMDIIP